MRNRTVWMRHELRRFPHTEMSSLRLQIRREAQRMAEFPGMPVHSEDDLDSFEDPGYPEE